MLLGADGQPILINGHAKSAPRIKGGEIWTGMVDRHGRAIGSKSFGGSLNGYLRALGLVDMSAQSRAREPLQNHAWVFACAITTAIVAGQAPFGVWRETGSAARAREVRAKQLGRPTYNRAGSKRRALERHVYGKFGRHVVLRGAERDEDNPIEDVLRRPNPIQQGSSQLWQLTHMLLALNGEAFWVLGDKLGGARRLGQAPEMIWVVAGGHFKPLFAGGSTSGGELVGWELNVPSYHPEFKGTGGKKINLGLEEVIQFKYPNPDDPIRGMSRLTAAALGIQMDLMVAQHGMSLLRNQAVPKGVVSGDVEMEQAEEDEFRRSWSDQFEGEANAGRTAFLFNGLQYQQVGLTPQDMQFLEQKRWNREEILAVMGMPPSVLGITQFTNYATQLGQDRNFWDKHLLPAFRLIEQTLDQTLFFPETDAVFGAFDLSGIEALRVGLGEKLDMAAKMCGPELHAPPRVAYEVVGIDVPDYDGDEVALASALLVPADSLVDPEIPDQPAPTEPPQPTEEEPDQPEEDQPPADDPAGEQQTDPAQQDGEKGFGSNIRTHRRSKAKASALWRAFVTLEASLEGKMRKGYRSWVLAEKASTLNQFDESTAEQARARARDRIKAVKLELILPDLKDSRDELKAVARPLYLATTEGVFDFTLNEIGIPTFAIDDARIVAHWDAREKIFIESVPKTIYNNLRTSLTEGIKAGETVQQLRLRISQVYDISASASRALTTARTETASLMNGVRNEMFGLQGISTEDWIPAGDEHTRPDHVAYGEAGPQPRGTNYLTISNSTGQSGVLEYPGDTRAPAGAVVNCRCVKGVAA